MMHKATTQGLALAILVAGGNAQSTASVAPAAKATAASGISQFVPAEFAGFGIEPSDLFYFTGGSQANQFSLQLMENLADYSGKPASIRVGGNSQDYSIYREAMDDYLVKLNPKPVGQGDVAPTDYYIIGPRYFEAINRFPAGSPITFGLNMAYYEADYLDQITTMAEAAVTKLNNVTLASFEVGNEPNIYLSNNFRNATNGNWTGDTYVAEWTVRAQAIYSRVLQTAKLPLQFFEGPCSASLIMETFGINQLVTDGMQAKAKVEDVDSTYLKSWNQHDYLYFIGQSNFSLTLNWLMGLNNTEWQFGHWADQVGVARATGLTYNLREMGSVGPVGSAGVSDTFGAALWTLNFFLYGAALNMSAINFHMTEDSYAGAWKPAPHNGDPQVVRPTYYAYAAMAQLLGSGNGTTQIAKLSSDSLPDKYQDRVRMYAGYGQGRLTSVIIINSVQANASQAIKGSLNVTLSLESYKGQNLYLSYLTADGADSQNTTVWNGMQYSNSDGTSSLAQDDTAQVVKIGEDGKAIVNVRNSQALIAYVGSLLGSNEVLLNSTIPDDDNDDGKDGSDGNGTSTGSSSNSSSDKSAAAIPVGPQITSSVFIIALWSWVAWYI